MSERGAGIIARPMAQLVQAIGRYFNPPSDTIRGLDPNTWYSPLQPIRPFGPPGTEPRGFQYWSGQNLNFVPRPDAEYSAAQLKQLSQYPLARICIENVKDMICRASWQIMKRPLPGETRQDAMKRGKGDQKIITMSRFFEKPNRVDAWDAWLRPLLEDMLVIDAGCVLIRKNFKNIISELQVLHGESIVRYVDVNGWTPIPPDPAYAQNWWGIPLVNLTTDQLVYKPRNIVGRNTISSMLYGMSPTEQLAPEIEIGIERLKFVLAYYTEGSVPGILQIVPKGTNPDKIAEAMTWMNSELAGNLAARRQIRLMQGWNEPGKNDQVIMTKEPLLADPFDDQLTKRITFGYGVSPQRLSKMTNRSVAVQQDEAAEMEGVLPYFTWLKSSVMDYLIQQVFGEMDYEWVPDPFSDPSFDKASKAVNEVMSKPVMTINEARDRMGLEARSEPEADELGMTTSTGWLPLKLAIQQAKAISGVGDANADGVSDSGKADAMAAAGDKAAGGKPNGKAAHAVARPARRDSSLEPTRMNQAKNFGFGAVLDAPADRVIDVPVTITLEKASALDLRPAVIHPGRSLPQSVLARHRAEKLLTSEFKSMRKKATRILARRVEKAQSARLKKANEEDRTEDEITKALQDNWKTVGETIQQDLTDAALAGAAAGVVQIDFGDEGIISNVNETAASWASQRAAELVGMRRLRSGALVPNPRADMAITQTTQDKLKEIIKGAFEEKADQPAIERLIEQTGVFSDLRAATIARTEIARAQVLGNLTMWQQSKVVKTVGWQLSADHADGDECDELAENGPYDVNQVPFFPAHPNCMCQLVVEETA